MLGVPTKTRLESSIKGFNPRFVYTHGLAGLAAVLMACATSGFAGVYVKRQPLGLGLGLGVRITLRWSVRQESTQPLAFCIHLTHPPTCCYALGTRAHARVRARAHARLCRLAHLSDVHIRLGFVWGWECCAERVYCQPVCVCVCVECYGFTCACVPSVLRTQVVAIMLVVTLTRLHDCTGFVSFR